MGASRVFTLENTGAGGTAERDAGEQDHTASTNPRKLRDSDMAEARKLLSREQIARFSAINSSGSVLKLAVYGSALAGAWTALLLARHWSVVVVATFILGIVYAHGLELQHQCLHHRLLPGRRWSRLVGFLLGAPMLVSYTHYRTMHLHHHRFLGTPLDAEIFDYDENSLANWPRFVARAWNVARIPTFFKTLNEILRGRFPPQFTRSAVKRELVAEYLVLLLSLAGAVVASRLLWTPNLAIGWFCAWLLVGEPAHFLIELPEHIGCNKLEREIFENTRTLKASPLIQYITNRNNFHVEHHLYPGVAPRNLHLVHEVVKPHIVHHGSYSSFLLAIIKQIGKPS